MHIVYPTITAQVYINIIVQLHRVNRSYSERRERERERVFCGFFFRDFFSVCLERDSDTQAWGFFRDFLGIF